MRTNCTFVVTCAECGEPLTMEAGGKPYEHQKSGVECGSAMEIQLRLAVRPCVNCQEKYKRPAELLRQALESLDQIKPGAENPEP